MRLAIVGSRACDREAARAAIREVLDRYKPAVVVTGDVQPWNPIDALAAKEAQARGIPVAEKKAKVQNWKEGFMPRNIEIACDCDALVRITTRRAETYGSGWTRDYAKSLERPTEEIIVP